MARVSAPDVERLIIAALRRACEAGPIASDRDVVEAHLLRATVWRERIEVQWRAPESGSPEQTADGLLDIAFAPTSQPRKGISHTPSSTGAMEEGDRNALLLAIAKARAWTEAILADRSLDFVTIAVREKLGERYVRRLASLAYVSPRIVEAIVNGAAPAGLAATKLVGDLPLLWAEQERRTL